MDKKVINLKLKDTTYHVSKVPSRIAKTKEKAEKIARELTLKTGESWEIHKRINVIKVI